MFSYKKNTRGECGIHKGLLYELIYRLYVYRYDSFLSQVYGSGSCDCVCAAGTQEENKVGTAQRRHQDETNRTRTPLSG